MVELVSISTYNKNEGKGEPMKFNGSKLVMVKEGMHFRYEGGEYIEYYSVAAGMVVDVINVFDYAKGESNVKSPEDFEKAVREYIEELGKEAQ